MEIVTILSYHLSNYWLTWLKSNSILHRHPNIRYLLQSTTYRSIVVTWCKVIRKNAKQFDGETVITNIPNTLVTAVYDYYG